MGKDHAFAIGAVVAGGLMLLFYFSPPTWTVPSPRDWIRENLAAAPQQPVLVFIVGTPENVAVMRDAVGSDRIVVNTRDSFALDEGRVIAASMDAVGSSITAAGWIDRPVEIVPSPGRRQDVPRAPGREIDASPETQPMLSRAEAFSLLGQLD
ncbi:MAG: hypothetical protein V3V67_17550 [Myxococcota bacterium]